ncbi:MAG: MucR family transcriptional regulator [Magnetococcales bacterium]|nr:MucR family transcriptional regulator [Magnetococcales bacterium]
MSSDLLKWTAEIVQSYVSKNEMKANDVPQLLSSVHQALSTISEKSTEGDFGKGASVPAGAAQLSAESAVGKPTADRSSAQSFVVKPVPKVPIEDAVQKDAVICLLCGKSCRALKGHLTRSHKMSVEEYRKMFDLDRDFPVVAPSYSEHRRKLAIEAGLGDKLRNARKRKKKR